MLSVFFRRNVFMKQRVYVKSLRNIERGRRDVHRRMSLNKYNFRHGLAYMTYSRRDLRKW
jgi:hypothetical protein